MPKNVRMEVSSGLFGKSEMLEGQVHRLTVKGPNGVGLSITCSEHGVFCVSSDNDSAMLSGLNISPAAHNMIYLENK